MLGEIYKYNNIAHGAIITQSDFSNILTADTVIMAPDDIRSLFVLTFDIYACVALLIPLFSASYPRVYIHQHTILWNYNVSI